MELRIICDKLDFRLSGQQSRKSDDDDKIVKVVKEAVDTNNSKKLKKKSRINNKSEIDKMDFEEKVPAKVVRKEEISIKSNRELRRSSRIEEIHCPLRRGRSSGIEPVKPLEKEKYRHREVKKSSKSHKSPPSDKTIDSDSDNKVGDASDCEGSEEEIIENHSIETVKTEEETKRIDKNSTKSENSESVKEIVENEEEEKKITALPTNAIFGSKLIINALEETIGESGNQVEKMECPQCFNILKDKQELKNHFYVEHDALLQCWLCPFKSIQPWINQVHLYNVHNILMSVDDLRKLMNSSLGLVRKREACSSENSFEEKRFKHYSIEKNSKNFREKVKKLIENFKTTGIFNYTALLADFTKLPGRVNKFNISLGLNADNDGNIKKGNKNHLVGIGIDKNKTGGVNNLLTNNPNENAAKVFDEMKEWDCRSDLNENGYSERESEVGRTVFTNDSNSNDANDCKDEDAGKIAHILSDKNVVDCESSCQANRTEVKEIVFINAVETIKAGFIIVYKCSNCYKSFRRKTKFSDHVKLCSESDYLQCPVCPVKCLGRSGFPHHTTMAHNPETSCLLCPFRSLGFMVVRRHMLLMHGIRVKPDDIKGLPFYKPFPTRGVIEEKRLKRVEQKRRAMELNKLKIKNKIKFVETENDLGTGYDESLIKNVFIATENHHQESEENGSIGKDDEIEKIIHGISPSKVIDDGTVIGKFDYNEIESGQNEDINDIETDNPFNDDDNDSCECNLTDNWDETGNNDETDNNDLTAVELEVSEEITLIKCPACHLLCYGFNTYNDHLLNEHNHP